MHTNLNTMDNTFFAPAEKEEINKIKERNKELSDSDYINFILNAVPELAAIINKDRQIIFSNDSLLNFLGIIDKEGVLGLRPGEAVNCINADLNKGGCGTSENCKYCGAVNAILISQDTMVAVTKECRITTKKDGTHEYLDLKVTSSPFKFNDNYYSILSVDDISDYKRRKILEKIFFHDVINLAGGLRGFVELLKDTTVPDEMIKYTNVVDKISQELLDEIVSQRTLTFAEHNDLAVDMTAFSSLEALKESAEYIGQHAIARNKKILVNHNALDITIINDSTLLKRVIINMIKNALEAVGNNSTGILNSYLENDDVVFSVNNEGFIPRDIQLQIFQRSFSTKGMNRGLGTYSIKLLTERYLKGKANFETSIQNGTTFFVKIPIQ